MAGAGHVAARPPTHLVVPAWVACLSGKQEELSSWCSFKAGTAPGGGGQRELRPSDLSANLHISVNGEEAGTPFRPEKTAESAAAGGPLWVEVSVRSPVVYLPILMLTHPSTWDAHVLGWPQVTCCDC